MKNRIHIITIVSLVTISLHAAEYLQFKDLDNNHKGYWSLEAPSATISCVEPLRISKVPPEDHLFFGFIIKYKKGNEGLTLEIISNQFLGFTELGPAKSSILTEHGKTGAVIPKKNGDWIEIQIKGRKPLQLKWVERELEPGGLTSSD